MRENIKLILVLFLLSCSSVGFTQDFSKCHAFLKIDNVIVDHPIPIDSIYKLKFETIDVVVKTGNLNQECYSFNIFYSKGSNQKEYQPYSQVVKNKQLDDGLKRELKIMKDGDFIYIENILFDKNQPKKMSPFVVKVENNLLVLGYCY
jgi:hypothetical protein